MAMDTTSAPANDALGSLFGPEPTATETPPVAAPTPEFAPVSIPVGPDPNNPVDPSQTPPAPVAPPPAPVPAPQAQPHMVPLPELLDTRRRAQAAEAYAQQTTLQNQQLMEALQRLSVSQQPQPQPIDVVAEPERAFQALQQKLAEQDHQLRELPQAIYQKVQADLMDQRLNDSERAARAKHGDAAVDQAIQAVKGNDHLKAAFRNQADPYGSLLQWQRSQEFAQRIGTDPAAYEAQVRERARQELMAELKRGAVPSNIPPSITSATNGATAPQTVGSDKDFFTSAFARRTAKPG